jgi:hypothetical protein
MTEKPLRSKFPKTPGSAQDITEDLKKSLEQGVYAASGQQAASEKDTIEFLKSLGYDWPRIQKFLGKTL